MFLPALAHFDHDFNIFIELYIAINSNDTILFARLVDLLGLDYGSCSTTVLQLNILHAVYCL